MTAKRNDNQSDEITEAEELRTLMRRLGEVDAEFREARKQLVETRERYDWAHYDDYAENENA